MNMTTERPSLGHWALALSMVNPQPLPIPRGNVPSDPGVYIWFRQGDPIYVGEALGAEGLRGRLRAHFSKGLDLSRSTLRASIAVKALGIERTVARKRPTVMKIDQVEVVNQWLAACELGWISCSSPKEAHDWEIKLRSEWLPPLNLV